MWMANHIFISYSAKDKDFVDRLSADLQHEGYDVWVDRQRLVAGASWVIATDKAISTAQAFIIVISKSSIRSSWVMYELDMAFHRYIKRKVKIYPILIEELDIKGIAPNFLQAFQPAYFNRGYETAFGELLSALPKSIKANHPLQEVAPKTKGYFFISYAEEDASFIETMREFLRERGYGYWDYQESERNYDMQLFLELEQRIQQAAAVLCILSPDWKRSQWAPKEYLFAKEVQIPTFLLMVREMGPTLVTVGVPYINFVSDITKGFEKLDQELSRKKLI